MLNVDGTVRRHDRRSAPAPVTTGSSSSPPRGTDHHPRPAPATTGWWSTRSSRRGETNPLLGRGHARRRRRLGLLPRRTVRQRRLADRRRRLGHGRRRRHQRAGRQRLGRQRHLPAPQAAWSRCCRTAHRPVGSRPRRRSPTPTASTAAWCVNGLDGDDAFALDDTSSSMTVNGGNGNDIFRIGQLFTAYRRTTGLAEFGRSRRADFVDTTRGLLSNGVSDPATINGGTGDDIFDGLPQHGDAPAQRRRRRRHLHRPHLRRSSPRPRGWRPAGAATSCSTSSTPRSRSTAARATTP